MRPFPSPQPSPLGRGSAIGSAGKCSACGEYSAAIESLSLSPQGEGQGEGEPGTRAASTRLRRLGTSVPLPDRSHPMKEPNARSGMWKRMIHGGGLGLLAAGVVLGLWRAGVLQRLEFPTWDWRVGVFAPHTPPSPQVKIILVDQASLDWGKNENGWVWPWPRTVYSAVLDFCKRSGAKAVAFDMLYTEPSSYGAGDDQALNDAIRRTPGFVGALFLSSQSGEATNWPAGELPIASSFLGSTNGWGAIPPSRWSCPEPPCPFPRWRPTPRCSPMSVSNPTRTACSGARRSFVSSMGKLCPPGPGDLSGGGKDRGPHTTARIEGRLAEDRTTRDAHRWPRSDRAAFLRKERHP